ncbi:MAG: hypothetical protein V1891_01120 [bacterium]
MKLLKIIYKYWMRFANLVGEINSCIILSVIFICIIGIYGIIKKIFVFFRFSYRDGMKSYWKEKKYRDSTIEKLKQQF